MTHFRPGEPPRWPRDNSRGSEKRPRDPSTVTPWPRDDPVVMFALVAVRNTGRSLGRRRTRDKARERGRGGEGGEGEGRGREGTRKTGRGAEEVGGEEGIERLASEGAAECQPDGSGSLIIVITSRGCTSILDHYRPLHIYHLSPP